MGSRKAHAKNAELERRGRVLTRKSPAIGRSIARAFVLKDGDVFFLANQNGDVPEKGPHGFGLYHHDCRFLRAYVLTLDGRSPIPLASTSELGFKGIFELTNPVLPKTDGGKVDKHEIAVRWDRLVEGDQLKLHDLIRVKSFAAEPADVALALSFRAGFEDVFAVRGLLSDKPGRLHPAAWVDGVLRFTYDGADGIRRTTDVQFWRPPCETEGTIARFLLHLEPEAEEEISLCVVLSETPVDRAAPPPVRTADPANRPDVASIEQQRHASVETRKARMTVVRTGAVTLDAVMGRSLQDLAMLRSRLADRTYYAAGVPWFVALFGRDALVVALETLAYDPDIARDTLRLLAHHQGRALDPTRDEEPGKILHEYRVGELAHVGAVPHTPYYGSVDATPLFLVTLARHAAWTGRLDLFHELHPNVNAALAWIERYGQSAETGYVDYDSPASGGLANQGWKDSGDAIVMKDGSLARAPIALVEVQGYVYLAKTSIASLLDRAGEGARAADLRREAEALKARFARDFWLPDEGFLALALTPDGPAAVLSSNAGQALWTGIVAPEHARATMESLLSEPMWSGWGVRTLSGEARRYNPIAYHRGTVWPHDNALITAGLRRHGFDGAACQVTTGILEASMHFPMHRLPELFSGFRRADYGLPVRYPVACHPQAWAAGSVPFMLATLLGLEPDAFEGRLRVVRPVLPESVGEVELRGLRVGSGSVDLAFVRRADGGCDARVLEARGGVDVEVEP